MKKILAWTGVIVLCLLILGITISFIRQLITTWHYVGGYFLLILGSVIGLFLIVIWGVWGLTKILDKE